MKHHHARGPEETLFDMPPLVSTERASRGSATCLRKAGVPDNTPAENPSKLARAESCYAIAYRLDQRAVQKEPEPEALRLPAPLTQLPWDLAKDQFGTQGADFIRVMAALLVRKAKDQFRAYVIDSAGVSGTLSAFLEKTSPEFGHTEPRANDAATGVSPARPVLGTPASPPCRTAAAVDCITG